MAGIRYWSVTHKAWQTLIVQAHATDAQNGTLRPDYGASDFKPGWSLTFQQTDAASGTVRYAMNVRSITDDKVVLDVENSSPVLLASIIPLFGPGDLKSLYVFKTEGRNTWSYYNLVAIGQHASFMTDGNEESTVNRAVAWFRHLAGVATDVEPPASR